MKNGLTVDEIKEQFSKKEITKISGEPNLKNVQKLEEEIQENASNIDTSLGGGNHGHLGMVMPANDYLALSGTPFAAPQNPGYQPVFGPAVSTAALREAATNQWKEAQHHYDTHKNVMKASRNQILEAVDGEYLQSIREHPLASKTFHH